MKLGGPIRAEPGEDKKKGHRQRGNDLGKAIDFGYQHGVDHFTETDTIKGNRNGLCQEENNSDRPAEFESQGAGYQVIITAALNFHIGGDGRKGYTGQYRNAVG